MVIHSADYAMLPCMVHACNLGMLSAHCLARLLLYTTVLNPLLRHWLLGLVQVGADLGSLSQTLLRPLRPLWISQNSLIWLNEVADPADLPFTPLYLVSASAPNARQRRNTGLS